jgi:hypothetical protein
LGNNTNHNEFPLLRVSAFGYLYLDPKAINWGHENSLPATLKSKTSHAAWITTLIIFLYKAQLTTNG